jgi:hypothetical protein
MTEEDGILSSRPSMPAMVAAGSSMESAATATASNRRTGLGSSHDQSGRLDGDGAALVEGTIS